MTLGTSAPSQGKTAARRRRNALPMVEVLTLVGLACALLMVSLPGSALSHEGAQGSRARLDAELRHARVDMGIPDVLLAPIERQERASLMGVASWGAPDAANRYDGLYKQTLAVEASSAQTLSGALARDINVATVALSDAQALHHPALLTYTQRLDDLLGRSVAVTRPGDIAALDTEVQALTAALDGMRTSAVGLDALRLTLRSAQFLGADTTQGMRWYEDDLGRFRSALTAADFAALDGTLNAQTTQLVADGSVAPEMMGQALLQVMGQQIDAARQSGVDVSALQQQYTRDAQALKTEMTPAEQFALTLTMQRQAREALPTLLRADAQRDLHALVGVIAVAQARHIRDQFTGAVFPAGYEYADDVVGVGAVTRAIAAAKTPSALLAADDQTRALLANAQAMLTNMGDATPPQRAHATDLQLLTQDGFLQGKVIVVSVREQVARFYENGQVVYWSYVTTGRPERPTPPGIHYALRRYSPVTFVSSEPRNSPLWYAPTPVQYGIEYAEGGYFLHDAWWRTSFGPGTNLPHNEPEAFNGGSHGCINFPVKAMAWVYTWTPLYTPVIVY